MEDQPKPEISLANVEVGDRLRIIKSGDPEWENQTLTVIKITKKKAQCSTMHFSTETGEQVSMATARVTKAAKAPFVPQFRVFGILKLKKEECNIPMFLVDPNRNLVPAVAIAQTSSAYFVKAVGALDATACKYRKDTLAISGRPKNSETKCRGIQLADPA